MPQIKNKLYQRFLFIFFYGKKMADFWDPKTNFKIEQEAGDCRWSRKDKSLRKRSEFSESIDQSEFRLVPEKLQAFKETQYLEANITW